jgi:hypothetical protein
LQSLENEDVIIEYVFLDKQENDDYLIYDIKAHSLQKAREVASKSELEIDKYPKKGFKEFCEGRKELQLLADFHLR